MDKCELRKQRILAVLDYDGIQECDRIAHLMGSCRISRYMAKRALNGVLPRSANQSILMAQTIDVCFVWLHTGHLERFHPRTAMIQMVMIDGKEMYEAAGLVETIASEIPGQPMYVSFGWYPNGRKFDVRDLIMLEQLRRMSEWEKGKHIRLMLRLLNNDTKVNRLIDMAARGQITRAQLYAAM